MAVEPDNRRPKAVVMLNILLAGLPIKFADDGQEYYYQDGMFGVKATKTNTDNPEQSEEVLLGADMPLDTFIRLCDKISFEDIFLQGSQMVLTLYNRRRRP